VSGAIAIRAGGARGLHVVDRVCPGVQGIGVLAGARTAEQVGGIPRCTEPARDRVEDRRLLGLGCVGADVLQVFVDLFEDRMEQIAVNPSRL